MSTGFCVVLFVLQLQQHLRELAGFNSDPVPSHTISLTREEITKTVSAMSERAKKLPKVRVSKSVASHLSAVL